MAGEEDDGSTAQEEESEAAFYLRLAKDEAAERQRRRETADVVAAVPLEEASEAKDEVAEKQRGREIEEAQRQQPCEVLETSEASTAEPPSNAQPAVLADIPGMLIEAAAPAAAAKPKRHGASAAAAAPPASKAEEADFKLPARLRRLQRLASSRAWKIGDFELGCTLGTGTFGRVRMVKFKDGLDRTPMALKVMSKEKVIKLKQVRHVHNEKETLSMILHPFVVVLFATFQDATRLYMLMEYLVGGELFARMRRRSTERWLVESEAKLYTGEIVLALEHLHGMNIVYRDMKPENILLNSEGHVKLTDFGFAKVVERRTYTLCGTPEYVAPEIINSSGHGKSVDWWALGILVFEMLAGHPPFWDENVLAIYNKILAAQLEFPARFSDYAKDFIKRLLSVDRKRRLGMMKGRAEDVKGHKFFKGLNWDDVFHCRVAPEYRPHVQGEDDTTHFDRYGESDEDPLESAFAAAAAEKDRDVFSAF